MTPPLSPGLSPNRARSRFGVVAGLGAIGGADLLLKLVKATPATGDHEHLDITFKQRPFGEKGGIADRHYDPTHRKFHVYNALKAMEDQGCDIALLPCVISHSFLHEIRPELTLAIPSMMDAIRMRLDAAHPACRRIGVLTSDFARHSGLWRRELGQGREALYPGGAHEDAVMRGVYGAQGLKAGRLKGPAAEQVIDAARDLERQGAEVIILGMTELPVLADALAAQLSVPILDCNQAYADFAVQYERDWRVKAFRIGVVGGVGPAATVDFMDKIVRRTDAQRDQDHLQMVVDHNPQIPDRTAHLIADGEDPTIPLYATCKRLEAEGANIIAIPCNTAHAYVARIQPHLSAPIVNMLTETVAHIRRAAPALRQVGVLATDGSVRSEVYRGAIEQAGLSLLLPDAPHQKRVMQAIYGERGVKAGFTDGVCREDLIAAITHLRDQGAQAVILGCTELPLIAPDAAACAEMGLPMLVDPTDVLAERCVGIAQMGR